MAEDSQLRSAVVQMAPVLGGLDENFARHHALLAEARAGGARLVVFPELSLTGYRLGPEAPRHAMDRDDPRLLRLAEAAGDAHVVVGLVEEDRAARLFNAAFVLHRGAVQLVHRKLELPTYGNLEEGKLFAPGYQIDTLALPAGFTASVLVCADAWNPILPHLAALHGATVLAVPSCSARDAVSESFSNPQGWELVLRFHAMVYGLPVLYANRVGREAELVFWGGSRILDPHGHTLAQAGDQEEILFADLDFAQVRRARFELPTVRDARLGLLRRELARLDAGAPLDGSAQQRVVEGKA